MKSGFPIKAERASSPGDRVFCEFGKGLERRSQPPHNSDATTLHPTPFTKHTREAQKSVPPAGFPTNRPGGKNRQKVLSFLLKK